MGHKGLQALKRYHNVLISPAVNQVQNEERGKADIEDREYVQVDPVAPPGVLYQVLELRGEDIGRAFGQKLEKLEHEI